MVAIVAAGGSDAPHDHGGYIMADDKKSRTRNWAAVIYPNKGDECPKDWREILDRQHVPMLISPLHNPDGDEKKPHRHVLMLFDSVKTYEQVKAITDELHAPRPERVQSVKGYARYLCHLDNPDKEQYSISELISLGGADFASMMKPTGSDRYKLIAEMMQHCRDYNVTEFAELVEYALVNRYEDWFPLLCDSCSFVMKNYIASKRFQAQAAIERAERMAAADAATDVETDNVGD